MCKVCLVHDFQNNVINILKLKQYFLLFSTSFYSVSKKIKSEMNIDQYIGY